MQKILFPTICLFLFISNTACKRSISFENVSVDYSIPEGEWVDIVNRNGGDAYKVELENAPKAKAKLIEYQIINGEVNSQEVMDIIIENDKEIFDVELYPQGRQVQFNIKIGEQSVTRKLSVYVDETINNMFMQTHVDKIIPNEIPIFAYATGIPLYDDQNHLIGRQYCELKDAHVDPKYWAQQLNQEHYIYYTIKY